MQAIDFETDVTTRLVDDFIKLKIIQLRRVLLNKVDKLNVEIGLEQFYVDLLSYYQEGYIALEENYSPDETAHQVFSQFLQYIFHYLSYQQEDKIYIKDILMHILAIYDGKIFYRSPMANSKPMLWVEPNSGETALISLCRRMDTEMVYALLSQLIKSCQQHAAVGDLIQPEFDNYFFNENILGKSALSLTWIPDRTWTLERVAIRNLLLTTAEKIYGNRKTSAFRHFLFQVDEQGTSLLMRLIQRKQLNNIIIDSVGDFYGNKKSEEVQQLLLWQDNAGDTILHYAAKFGSVEILKNLLKKVKEIFITIENPSFRRFITLRNKEGISAFLLATQYKHLHFLKSLFFYIGNQYLNQFDWPQKMRQIGNYLLQTDNQGYSQVARAIETSDIKIVNQSLKMLTTFLINDYYPNLTSDFSPQDVRVFVEFFKIKTNKGLSILHLAVQTGKTSIVRTLLTFIYFYIKTDSNGFRQIINQEDNQGRSTFQYLSDEEKNYRQRLRIHEHAETLEESTASEQRQAIAKILVEYNAQILNLPLPEEWVNLKEHAYQRPSNYFEIFCPHSARMRRATLVCTGEVTAEYQPFVESDLLVARKTVFANMMAFLSEFDLTVFSQAYLLRNTETRSVHENQVLTEFEEKITQYFDRAYNEFVAKLSPKKTNLVAARAAHEPLILLDNGNDFLVIKDNRFFSPRLLSATTAFALKPNANIDSLKNWLNTYFSSEYEVYAFTSELIQPDSLSIAELRLNSFSDKFLAEQKILGLRRKKIQDLFLINNQFIEHKDLANDILFADISSRSQISFRPERFHELFFSLGFDEKKALQDFLHPKEVSIAYYHHLVAEEKNFLKSYGQKIVHTIKSHTSIADLSETHLLEIALESHQEQLVHNTLLTHAEGETLTNTFFNLKNKILNNLSLYGKTSAQLLVFLLPSTIRSIAKKSFNELVIPLGGLAADVVLRNILTQLISHPLTLKLFSGTFAQKLVHVLEENLQRLPIVAAPLALFGIIHSANALMQLDEQDPQRAYYAHALMNSLASIAVMGGEVAEILEFWPALGLYALLTVDQLILEGSVVHEQMHLQDDQNHPLLKYYREFKLSLGIVDIDIQILAEQQTLFQSYLAYLAKMKAAGRSFNFIAVPLPAMRQLNETDFLIDKKSNFSFSAGEVKTICEKIDPFYFGDMGSDYTLLASTRDTHCLLGQEKTTPLQLNTSENAAAAILADTAFTNHTEKSNLLLLVDPGYVATCSVFYPIRELLQAAESHLANLCASNVCSNEKLASVNKVTVIIAAFFAISNKAAKGRTSISVRDNFFIDSPEEFFAIKQIEYFILESANVSIEQSYIASQSFKFIGTHRLALANNNLISESEEGFFASLSFFIKLNLEFSEATTVFGSLRPSDQQQVIVNQFQGISAEKPAIFLADRCNDYSIGLSTNSHLVEKSFLVTLAGTFNKTMLRITKKSDNESLYQLIPPVNDIKITSLYTEILVLTIHGPSSPQLNTIHIMSLTRKATTNLTIYGRYIINNRYYFVKMSFDKTSASPWQSCLEINLNKMPVVDQLDLDVLKQQGFSKVSTLNELHAEHKITHYYFLQEQAVPTVNGHFIAYTLEEKLESWLLTLQHKDSAQQTQCSLAENVAEIIIERIRYQIDSLFSRLLAIGSADNSTVEATYLLAPLKIETTLSELAISQYHGVIALDDQRIQHPNFETKIQLSDTLVPIYFLLYRQNNNATALLSLDASPYQNSKISQQQMQEQGILIKSSYEKQSTFQWGKYLSAGCVFVATAIGGGFFIRRFRHARLAPPPAAAVVPAAIPLLSGVLPSVKAQTQSSYDFAENLAHSLAALKAQNSLNFLQNIQNEIPSKNTNPLTMGFSYLELNQQLFFYDYLVRWFFRLKSEKTMPQIKINVKHSAQVHFFTTTLSVNDKLLCPPVIANAKRAAI